MSLLLSVCPPAAAITTNTDALSGTVLLEACVALELALFHPQDGSVCMLFPEHHRDNLTANLRRSLCVFSCQVSGAALVSPSRRLRGEGKESKESKGSNKSGKSLRTAAAAGGGGGGGGGAAAAPSSSPSDVWYAGVAFRLQRQLRLDLLLT